MPSLSPVDAHLDAFDQAWESGSPPDLDEALRKAADLDAESRLELLTGLVMIDLERRWRNPDLPGATVEEYLQRYPELDESARDDLICEEFRVRHRVGDGPSIAEYAKRFGESAAAPLQGVLNELQANNSTQAHRNAESTAAQGSMTVAEFQRRLVDSGVMTAAEIEACRKTAKQDVQTGEDLAKLLVRHKKLTKFQAQMIYGGKGGSLVLGNYVVLDRIGAGGMGQVFKAMHRRMERVVALKVLPPGKMKDASANERFEREVKAAARLSHPNIVTAHDADQHGKTHFLVMEYVDGIDLSALVQKSGPLTVDRAVNYVLQAAAGLQYAHEQGVIHRDIKPGNLLIDRQGNVRVLDMGLAHIDDASTDLTSTGDVMGTIDYMSPEQAADTKNADARSDIYSLGCTLYFLLQGKPPYGGDTVVSRVMAHRDKPIPPLAADRTDVPGTLEMVFSRMLAKDPLERYGSMQEAAAALNSCGVKTASAVASSGGPVDPELQMLFESWELDDESRIASPATASTQRTGMAAETATRKKHTAGRNRKRSSSKNRSGRSAQGAKPADALTRKVLWWSVGGFCALVLAVILGVTIFRVKTPEGTIVLKLNQPAAAGAVVTVDGKKKITIKTGDGDETFEITADGKEHTLKIEHPDFVTYAKRFVAKSNGKQVFEVTLDPKEVVADKNQSIDKTKPAGKSTSGGKSIPKFIGDADLKNLKLKYFDEFDDSRSGFWIAKSEDRLAEVGYRNGRYTIHILKGPGHSTWSASKNWDSSFENFACQVVGRTIGDDNTSWALQLNNYESQRGIAIYIRRTGEFAVLPGRAEKLRKRPYVEWKRDPVIKTGDAFNTVSLVVRERLLQVYINGKAVCLPVTMDEGIVPGRLQLTLDCGKEATAEFERMAVWSLQPAKKSTPESKRIPEFTAGSDLKNLKLRYFDEFDDPRSGFSITRSTDGKAKVGYRDGHYYIDVLEGPRNSTWSTSKNWSNTLQNFACEVVGRTTGDDNAIWALQLNNYDTQRGVAIYIKRNGEFAVLPGRAERRRKSPYIKSTRHTAIKTGDAFNTVALVVRDRLLHIYVNGKAVCLPVTMDEGIVPGRLQLTLDCGKPASAEFERMTVWSLQGSPQPGEKSQKAPGAPPPAKAPFNAAQATAHQKAWAKSLGVPVEFTDSIGMTFRLIPPGEFTMGVKASEIETLVKRMKRKAVKSPDYIARLQGWGPQHKVLLTKPYYIGVHEVTQGQCKRVLKDNSPTFHFSKSGGGKGSVEGLETDEFPAESVSWKDAQEFCKRLNDDSKLAIGYRLPTEAEWENACRAGTDTLIWHDGLLSQVGWFGANSGGRPHKVAQLLPNPYGLYDVHGNVHELCQDTWNEYSDRLKKPQPVKDPLVEVRGGMRINRGGSWKSSYVWSSYSGARSAMEEEARATLVGFRVALSVDAVRQMVKSRLLKPAEVDLLSHLDLDKGTVRGKWSFVGKALQCSSEPYARLQTGYHPPAEYDLTVTLERLQGTDCLVLGNVAHGRQFAVAIDLFGNGVGLTTLDGKKLSDNETYKRMRLLPMGKEHKIVCSIRKRGVSVICNGRTVIDWRGDLNRLSLSRLWTVPDTEGLFIGSHSSMFRIKSLKLKPIVLPQAKSAK